MKRQFLALLAFAGILGSSSAPVPVSPNTVRAATAAHKAMNSAVKDRIQAGCKDDPSVIRRRIIRELRGCKTGFRGVACTPKEYGQFLQRNGRQKWTKKGGKC